MCRETNSLRYEEVEKNDGNTQQGKLNFKVWKVVKEHDGMCSKVKLNKWKYVEKESKVYFGQLRCFVIWFSKDKPNI